MQISFVAGESGPWAIESVQTLVGEPLRSGNRLSVFAAPAEPDSLTVWTLKGFVSNLRYTTREERITLLMNHAPLERQEARCAALIPIRKSDAWWQLAQDERRHILEEQSRHIAIGLDYMPAIARRLHHCRDLGEPFDFLTWFEFAPEHAAQFNDMLVRLRETVEWSFVDREVDIRLRRD
jgi:chlorite dismutase